MNETIEQHYDLDVDVGIDDDFNSFLFTHPAWALSTSSASISTVSSIFVISFIYRSRDLSNPYHKIMLFMSFWDVLSSIAISLSTIPMPADVHDVYPFPGMAIGNALTCSCQGFFIIVGGMYTVWSNCTLNIYYVCTIRYGMPAETINRRLLPIMLGLSTVYVTVVSSVCASLGMLNPRPYEPFCLVGSYPHKCVMEDDVECIRGDASLATVRKIRNLFLFAGAVSFICILTSMVMVVLAVFRTELAWRQYDQSGGGDREERGQESSPSTSSSSKSQSRAEEFNNTRTALRQALMYIAAFLLTWMWLAIALIAGEETWVVNDPLKLFFQPLQGFFNAAIFFSSKVGILRKANSRLTAWQAFVEIIMTPSVVPQMLLSRIEALEDDTSSIDTQDYVNDYDHCNTKIKRTGMLRSGMTPVIGSIKSNDTPSFNLSRAIASSKEGFVDDKEVDVEKGEVNNNAIASRQTSNSSRRYYRWPPPKSPSSKSSHDSISNPKPKGLSSECAPDITSGIKITNENDGKKASEPKHRFYQWPPPKSTSSKSSYDSIWNPKSKASRSQCDPTANTRNISTPIDDSLLSQGPSSTGISAGYSTVSSVKSPNLSVLAELSFDDDALHSRKLKSDHLSQGLSYASSFGV